MFWEQYSHEPAIAVNRYWIAFEPEEARKGREELIAANHARGARALALMDSHLAGRDWFTGCDYGVADMALFAYTHVAEEGGFDLGPHGRVRHWIDRVRAQPGHIGLLEETSVEPVQTLAEASARERGEAG